MGEFKLNQIETKEKGNFNTTFKKIESGNVEDNIRIAKFENFSPEMKEALLVIGKIFKETKCPWAIQGSLALVLEAETNKQPEDIDLAFGITDIEKIYAQFEELKKNGVLEDTGTEEMKDLEGKKNSCIRIFGKIKTSSGKRIDLEAFAQNMDPNKPKNGLSNLGLDKIEVNIYEKNGTPINFTGREEMSKYYFKLAYIELQKYQMEDRSMTMIKNKFPQRMQNLVSIILAEKFETQLRDGKITKDQKLDIEEIGDEDIKKLIEEFFKYNNEDKILKINDSVHSTMDPSKIITSLFDEFRTQRYLEEREEKEGFVKSKIESDISGGREDVIDNLTIEQLSDMEEITRVYVKLIELDKSCENIKNCPENHNILKVSEKILGILKNVQKKYNSYLEKINYEDNRDFIPYVSIKAIMEDFITPALELAFVAQSKALQEVYA